MKMDLAGQTILITGASGGIGSATARTVAAAGARLALHYHTNQQAVQSLHETLPTESLTVQADLGDESQTASMFQHVIAAFTRIDGIVVNAGIWPSAHTALHEMSLDQWSRTIKADLTSAFLTCREFMRHLNSVRRKSASIVLVGSTAALFGEAGHCDYAAAKAAMVYGLTHTLKNEIVALAPQGRVNCVCPGWTITPMTAQFATDPVSMDRATATVAMGKVAEPADIAGAIAFLCCEQLAGHISGAILPVTGGMEGRLLHDVQGEE